MRLMRWHWQLRWFKPRQDPYPDMALLARAKQKLDEQRALDATQQALDAMPPGDGAQKLKLQMFLDRRQRESDGDDSSRCVR